MIVRISGKVLEVHEHSVTLEAGHLAYEILVPTGVVEHYRQTLQNRNGKASEPDIFYTIQYIEGASGHGNQFMRLVGFRKEIEKEFFQLYTSVEGIGYKTALKSLILPIPKIALAIERNDLATLKKLPHVGGRTAEKMVATLRGKMQKFALGLENEPLTVPVMPDLHSEVHQVLRQVGYAEQESDALIQKVLVKNPDIKSAEQMIQEIFSLKKLNNN